MFLATILGIWGTVIHDEMLIPDKTIWLTVLAGSLIATTIFFLALENYFDRWKTRRIWSIVYVLFFGTVVGGQIAFFAINVTNYYVKGDEVMEKVTLDIIDTGRNSRRRSSKCSSTFVLVKLKQVEYKVSFSCEYEHTIAQYKKVDLTLTKGGLGYYMIVDKSLVGIEE